nr:hypothetical protein [Tanacetum cinerariifolium]
ASLCIGGSLAVDLGGLYDNAHSEALCYATLEARLRAVRWGTPSSPQSDVLWEATVPLFISFLTVGPAGDWLTFQKRPRPNIPLIFGNSMSNIPDWKSEFIFVKQTLISDIRPADQPIDVGSPSVDHMKVAFDNDEIESSSVSKNKDVSGFKLVALEEEATIMGPVSKKRKPKGPRRTSIRGSFPSLPTTAPKGARKHPRVLARYIRNLASSSDSLAPEELEGLKPRVNEAERLEQRCRELESKRDFLLKEAEKVVDLSSKLNIVDLEKAKLVKDFLPLAVKKLFESKHFNHNFRDLQQKAITFGR